MLMRLDTNATLSPQCGRAAGPATEVEKEKTLALRKFNANIEGFKEGSKEFLAALQIYNDEIKAIDDAEAERKKKYQDDLNKSGLESINQFYDAQIIALKEKNAAQSVIDAAETQRLQDLIAANAAIFGEGSQQEIDARLKLYDFKKGLQDKEAENSKKLQDQEEEARKKSLDDENNAIAQRYSLAASGFAQPEKGVVVAYHRDRGEPFDQQTNQDVPNLFNCIYQSCEEFIYCFT